MRVPQQTAAARLAITLLAGTSVLAITPAAAQEAAQPAAEETTTTTNTIVVTALKREQNLQDVPLAITAFGTEQLEDLHVNDVADAVKFLPSVTLQGGTPGFNQIYFRGVSSGENANHSASLPTVGTYLDEMPVTTIQGALDIHAYDLNRIEALAGPQGTLYGASSMAGTIKLVTNAPDPSGFYGAADLELNTVSHGEMGGIAEGFVNVPISSNAAIRAVGWYRKDGGYIDNVHGSRVFPSLEAEQGTAAATQDNAALVEEDYNDVEIYGGRVSLGIDLNDSWTIRPTVMGQVTKTNGSFDQERSTAVSDDLQTVQYNPEFSKDEWIQAALTVEGKIGSWDMVAAGGYLWRDDEVDLDYSDYSYFYDAISGYGAYFYDNDGDLVSPNQYIQGSDKYRRWFGELRVSSPAENRLRVIGGLFAQRQAHLIEQNYIIDNIADVITVPGTESNIWLTKQQRVDRDYAAFGELSYDLTDKLTATAGARIYNYKNSLVGFFGYAEGYSGDKTDPMGDPDVIVRDGTGVAGCGIGDAPPRPPVVEGSPCTNLDKTTSDTDAIYKVNLTYQATEDALVYATFSQGFRPGGINRRGTLPPYGPDTLDNYEVGWKATFGPVYINAAVYQLDWKNIQLSFLGPNGLTEIRNAGIARIRGVELATGYSAGGLTVNLSGSINDAKTRRDFCKFAVEADPFDCSLSAPDSQTDDDLLPEPNEVLAPAGTQLPVTPMFKGNAVVRYEFPIGSWDGHVQGAVSHIGSRRSDLRDLENAIKGPFDAYTTADFSIGVEGERYRIELFATNLFDARGVIDSGVQCVETICGDPDGVTAGGGVFYDTVIKPRTVGLKVGADF